MNRPSRPSRPSRKIAVIDVQSFETFAEQIAAAKRSRGEAIAFLEAALEVLRGQR